MRMLVERQGEVIVKIDDHAEHIAGDLKEGNRAVNRAVDFARSTRAVCIFVLRTFLFMGVINMIIIIINFRLLSIN